jgi:hypothetical protein
MPMADLNSHHMSGRGTVYELYEHFYRTWSPVKQKTVGCGDTDRGCSCLDWPPCSVGVYASLQSDGLLL